jgi:hypothetical protein
VIPTFGHAGSGADPKIRGASACFVFVPESPSSSGTDPFSFGPPVHSFSTTPVKHKARLPTPTDAQPFLSTTAWACTRRSRTRVTERREGVSGERCELFVPPFDLFDVLDLP